MNQFSGLKKEIQEKDSQQVTSYFAECRRRFALGT